MSTGKLKWPYWLIAAIVIGGGLWYTADDWLSLLDGSKQEPAEPVVVVVPTPQKPLYPVAQPAPTVLEEELAPLPLLNESDSYAHTELSDVFGERINDMLVDQELIFKLVAATDSLSAALTPRQIWPLKVKTDSFKVVAAASGNDEEFNPNPKNHHRYDQLVNLVASANAETMADVYRQMYPLLQETYVGLGYPDGYFNDRLIATIDLLLSTPEPAEPIVLVRPHVLYKYADPDLEQLSGGQKQLLRMGPANAAKVKQSLQTFRQQIIQDAVTEAEAPPET